MADGVSISKWSILVLTCATAFGSYYSFETPSVLHNAMFKHYGFTNDTEFELYFSLIYSLYALPNTVIPLVGGLLADKFGNKKIMLLFASFVLLGSAIETVACFQKSMALFLFGRFIFGCGAETLNVCCSIVISKWFKGQELALALAINLSLSKLATVVTDWTSPLMYRSIGIENNAIWVTTLCLICYLLTVLLLKYDTDESNASQMQAHADRLLGDLASRMRSTDDAEAQHLLSGSAYNDNISAVNGIGRSIELGQLPGTSQPRRRIVDGSAAQESESESAALLVNSTAAPLLPHPARSASQRVIKPSSSDENIQYLPTAHTGHPTSEPFTFLGFGLPVWGLFCFTFVMYGTFIPFTNWSSVILIRFYFNRASPSAAYVTYREITAARLQSIPNFISVLLTPVFGVSVDWFGRRTALLTSSAVLLIAAHSIIYTHALASAILPLVMIGLAFSIFGSVIWPCVPVVVAADHQGTAYGVMTSFQNAGQFVVPLLLQYIYRQYVSFVPCEGFFIAISCVGTAVALALWVVDEYWNNAILRLPDRAATGAHKDAGAGGMMLTRSASNLSAEAYDKSGAGVGAAYGAQNQQQQYGQQQFVGRSGEYGSLEGRVRRASSDNIVIGNTPPLSRRNSQAQKEGNNSAYGGSNSSSLTSNSLLCGSPSLVQGEDGGLRAHANSEVSIGDGSQSDTDALASSLVRESKFARLRAFSMAESRPSLSNNLYTLSEESSQASQQSSSRASQPGPNSTTTGGGSVQTGGSSSPSSLPLDPILVIPIPSVVHHSQEYYERANTFQFPREDPLILRRQISERSRTYAPPWLGIAGMAQSAPGESQMEQYQRYRQLQIMAHNQMAPAQQQQQLLLGPTPRRRSIF